MEKVGKNINQEKKLDLFRAMQHEIDIDSPLL
jgi:hypothetical protein